MIFKETIYNGNIVKGKILNFADHQIFESFNQNGKFLHLR